MWEQTLCPLVVGGVGFLLGNRVARKPGISRTLTHGRKKMAGAAFRLWDSLAEGKCFVTDLTLCRVLLVNDSNYPLWLVLVPRQNELREVLDLSPEDQQTLWKEVTCACRAVQVLGRPHKLNVAAIGNVCAQLHVHVTGRTEDDPAWPGPCYGAVPAKPFEEAQLATLLRVVENYLQSAQG